AELKDYGSGTTHLTAGALASILTGGTGANYLIGSPQDDELTGGSSSNLLDAGAGNDTIILGSGSNIVNGGSGHNIIVVQAPIYQNAIVTGGTDPNNSLQIIGNPDTYAISAVPSGGSIDIGLQNTPDTAVVH